MINYYNPSRSLVDYLQKELQSLQSLKHDVQLSDAGGNKSSIVPKRKRAKEGRDKIAKTKHDAIGHIFKAFADIVYFLEFIEGHEELHDLYEKDLKDLFGINEDPATRKHHYQNRGGPIGRLLSASLFYHVSKPKLDFHMQFINMVLDYAIHAMQHRIDDTNELNLLLSDASRVLIWSKLLTNKVQNDKNNKETTRSLGFIHQYDSIQKMITT